MMIRSKFLDRVLIVNLAATYLLLVDALNAQNEWVELEPYTVHSTRLDPVFEDFTSSYNEFPKLLEPLQSSLSKFAGSYFNNPLGYSGNSELIVRGGEANFTKVRIEGIEVNNPTDSRGGGFGFALLAGMPIEKMTLTNGSSSSVDGTGAVSGSLGFELGSSANENALITRIGEFGYRYYGAVGHGSWKNTQISGGINHSEESSRYHDHEFKSDGGFLKSSFSLSENSKIWLSAWTSETEQIRLPEDSGGPLYSTSTSLDRIEAQAVGLSLRYLHRFHNDSSIAVVLGRYIHDNDSSSPGVEGGERNPFGVPANEFIDSFNRTQLELVYRCSNWDKIDFSAGFERQVEDAKSESVVHLFPGFSLPSSYDVERHRNSVFTEAGYEFLDQHFLILSERYDSESDHEAEWSSGLKYGVRSEALNGVYYVSFQEAYKTPSLFATNNAMVGNPDLKAETNETYELGASGTIESNDLSWRMALFSQKYTNLIDLSEATQTLVNLSSVDIQGFEIELGFKIQSSLKIEVQATLLNLELQEKNEVLRYRPEQQIRTSLIWSPNEQQQFLLHYALTGKRWDSSIPTGNRQLDTHHELALSWMAQWGDNFKTSLGIRNLLNLDHEILIGYEAPGTSVSASIAWVW